MDDQVTDEMNGKRPFEDRVFGRFDAVDSSIRLINSFMHGMDERLQKLEIWAYDTKPIWERALKEIIETRRELSKRLDLIEAVVYKTLSDLSDVEDHLDRIDPKPTE
ncbi:MAG: hypothetical protein ABJA18_12930 [bacterium]